MLAQVQVGSSNPTLLGGPNAEAIVSELHGKYYYQTRAGNVFIGSTAAAGVVPPIYSNTAQTFALWNPTGSGKNLSLISLRLGIVTVGVVTSDFCMGYQTGAGSAIGAVGAPISAFTAVAPVSALIGGGNTSVAKFAPAAVTTVAPSFLRTCGISSCMATSPTAANAFWQLGEDYDGSLIVPPGVVIFVANNIAGVATWNITLTWEEAAI